MFQLLLVPVGTDEYGAQGYLATINRLSYREALANPAPTAAASKGSASAQPPATTTPTQTPTRTIPSPSAVTPPATLATPATTTPSGRAKPVKKNRRPFIE